MASILLAAGQSSRFGAPKLQALLHGRPVGFHSASALQSLSLPINIAMCSGSAPDFTALGFDIVLLDPADAPMSHSIALGVEAARQRGATAVLIALADMPLVPLAHFRALITAFDGGYIGTKVAGKIMPPAIFGAAWFDPLCALSGDQGARDLLKVANAIELDPMLALDIDRPSDLDLAATH